MDTIVKDTAKNVNALITFSADENAKQDSDYNAMVSAVTNLIRFACKRYGKNEFLPVNYYGEIKDYDLYNEKTSKALFTYAIDQVYGIDEYTSASETRKRLIVQDENVRKLAFAIVLEALVNIVADNEVEDALIFADIRDCAPENSMTFEIDSKMIYPVQDSSYGANIGRFNQSYQSAITLTPKGKSLGVSFPFHMLRTGSYDFGKEMAKVAISFRARQYADIITTIFGVTSALTPFYSTTFAADEYMLMADKIRALNSSEVQAFGTNQAFYAISNNITTGFSVQDEKVKTGYIADIYGIRTIVIPQAVNTLTTSIGVRVPNDKIILMSGYDGDKPVKMVRSRVANVTTRNGAIEQGLDRMEYSVQMFWDCGIATKSHFGVQEV